MDRLVQAGTTRRDVRWMRRAARSILMTHSWPEMRDRLEAVQPGVAHWLTERGHVVHVVRDPKRAISPAWPVKTSERGALAWRWITRMPMFAT